MCACVTRRVEVAGKSPLKSNREWGEMSATHTYTHTHAHTYTLHIHYIYTHEQRVGGNVRCTHIHTYTHT